MKRHAKLWGAVALLAAMPLSARAQERGRTDGPEGSEYGKGGYADPGGGRFSLELNWGAAILQEEPHPDAPEGPPLFFGLTASFWGDDWYQLDVSGNYVLDGGQLNLLIGPRFRTYGYPVSLSLGLRAGAAFIPEYDARFVLSPQLGADFIVGNRDDIILGLAYATDIPLPLEEGEVGITHRVFLNVGYRF